MRRRLVPAAALLPLALLLTACGGNSSASTDIDGTGREQNLGTRR
ncbi:hypothetical protein AB0D11_01525 [Streptomyces monashensis]